jgi:hypothetical protein
MNSEEQDVALFLSVLDDPNSYLMSENNQAMHAPVLDRPKNDDEHKPIWNTMATLAFHHLNVKDQLDRIITFGFVIQAVELLGPDSKVFPSRVRRPVVCLLACLLAPSVY